MLARQQYRVLNDGQLTSATGSDITTMVAVATLLPDLFDTAATYPITALARHRPRILTDTVGTVLVRP